MQLIVLVVTMLLTVVTAIAAASAMLNLTIALTAARIVRFHRSSR